MALSLSLSLARLATVGCSLAALVVASGCTASSGSDSPDDAVGSDDNEVKVDTSSPEARRQYDANVAFATSYAARCTPTQATDGSPRPVARVLLTGFGRFMSIDTRWTTIARPARRRRAKTASRGVSRASASTTANAIQARSAVPSRSAWRSGRSATPPRPSVRRTRARSDSRSRNAACRIRRARRSRRAASSPAASPRPPPRRWASCPIPPRPPRPLPLRHRATRRRSHRAAAGRSDRSAPHPRSPPPVRCSPAWRWCDDERAPAPEGGSHEIQKVFQGSHRGVVQLRRTSRSHIKIG